MLSRPVFFARQCASTQLPQHHVPFCRRLRATATASVVVADADVAVPVANADAGTRDVAGRLPRHRRRAETDGQPKQSRENRSVLAAAAAAAAAVTRAFLHHKILTV